MDRLTRNRFITEVENRRVVYKRDRDEKSGKFRNN